MSEPTVSTIDVSVFDLWALLIGRNVMRFATTSQLMRHASPAGTTMYVHADTDTIEGVATAATKDFIDWCSQAGDRECEQGKRFLAFCASLGETPANAVRTLDVPAPTERAAS